MFKIVTFDMNILENNNASKGDFNFRMCSQLEIESSGGNIPMFLPTPTTCVLSMMDMELWKHSHPSKIY